MSVITYFQTLVVGSDCPNGESMMRLLNLQGLPHQGVELTNTNPLKPLDDVRGFLVITPSPYQLEQLQYLPYWLDQAQALDWPVLFVSSLAVFPAQQDTEWQEQDTDFAGSELAKAYLQAEELVKKLPKHFILRAGLPLFLDGNDFASRFLMAVRQQENWELNNKLMFNPTVSNNLAETMLAMLQQANCVDELWGIYHCDDVEAVTAFQLAQALLEQVRRYEDIPEVIISAVDEQGEQPRLWVPTGDNTKLFHVFGIRPKAWRQGLARLCKLKSLTQQPD